MTKLCKNCRKKSKCISLCQKAEDYVSQDSVKLKELLIVHSKLEVVQWPWPIPIDENRNRILAKVISSLSKTEIQTVTYLLAGISREKIIQLLKISPTCFNTRLSRLRKKINKP